MHLFMNINQLVRNNCGIKNTEMIFTLYIPSWDIHSIKVKLELVLPQQSEYSALLYTKLCNTFLPHSSYNGGQVSHCNISWDRSYNSTKGSEQEDEDAIFREWNHFIRGIWQKSVTELRI